MAQSVFNVLMFAIVGVPMAWVMATHKAQTVSFQVKLLLGTFGVMITMTVIAIIWFLITKLWGNA